MTGTRRTIGAAVTLLLAGTALLSGCGRLPVDVVPGGDDGDGELVRFSLVGPSSDAFVPRGGEAGELTSEVQDVDGALGQLGLVAPEGEHGDLPALDGDHRRFAFVLGGCQEDAARLVLEGDHLGATFVDTDGTVVNCVQAEYFLAVFDVATTELPAEVVLG